MIDAYVQVWISYLSTTCKVRHLHLSERGHETRMIHDERRVHTFDFDKVTDELMEM